MALFTEPLDFTIDSMVEEYSDSTPMKDYYKNKTVFLTGGTGSLGQLYLEKILRSDAKCVYLLIRPKDGKSVDERLQELFAGSLFTKLRSFNPNFQKRVKPICGDLFSLKCGISDGQLAEIYKNVEIVVHNAADVRLDEELAKLLIANLRSTREILKISENIKNLQVFAYISTAYSHCPISNIDEKFYEAPMDPETMIKLGEKYYNSSTDTLEVLTVGIIKPWPNTFFYTKSLSEEIVRRYASKFPVCIIRPSIIIATHEDPIPAWCNSFYGLNGVIYGTATGAVPIFKCDKNKVGDIICADFVANSTLACIWVTHEDNRIAKIKDQQSAPLPPEIYHVCSSPDRPVSWKEIYSTMRSRLNETNPTITPMKTCCQTTSCSFMFLYLTLMYHIVPAILSDIFSNTKKHPLRSLPSFKNALMYLDTLEYFLLNEWKFTNDNMKRVLSRMSTGDQEFYPSDVRRYEFETYSYNYALGLELYLFKKPLDETNTNSLERRVCLRIQKCLYIIISIVYFTLQMGLFYSIANQIGLLDYIKTTAINNYDFLQNPQQFNL